MRHTRRFIAILVGSAASWVAASSVAYAVIVDPGTGPAGTPVVTPPASSGMPLWEWLAVVTLVVLMAVAVVGLGYSLSHSRRSEPSPSSQTPLRS